MKTLCSITLITATFLLANTTALWAQRIIKGTVYLGGKPAVGVFVEAHNGGTATTGFEGDYQVEVDENTRWLRFKYQKKSQKLSLSGKSGNVFDFSLDGETPTEENQETVSFEVVLKTHDQLYKEQYTEYMSESSLYLEFYKHKYFDLALPHWKKVFTKYPKSSPNVYIHGVIMYENFIENAKTPEERNRYINEMMRIYDKRIIHFNEKGYVLGRKATAWLNYKLNTGDTPEGEDLVTILKRGYGWLSESVKSGSDNIELPVLLLFMQTTRSLFRLNELPEETVIKNYETCNNKLNSILAQSEDEEIRENATDVIKYIENIFDSSGAADCEALINIFAPRFEENSNDIGFIKNMLRRLGKADCDQSALFSRASEKLYELEPSAEAAFNMARMYVKRGEGERAKNYYQQAMKQESDNELLANYYYEYAYFIFAEEKAFEESRRYARKALDTDPDFCQALMLIGDIYVAASNKIGTDDFEKSTLFWLAVDYFQRARRTGYDCAVDASQKISVYREYFPGKEETFFRGLKEGDTYKVEGWINESTTVRF